VQRQAPYALNSSHEEEEEEEEEEEKGGRVGIVNFRDSRNLRGHTRRPEREPTRAATSRETERSRAIKIENGNKGDRDKAGTGRGEEI